MFLKKKMKKSTISYSDKLSKIKEKIEQADAIVIGAGAGLSTSAGFDYSGERFERYFSDYIEKYDFTDMYSGGFYSYDTLEEYWAYWSRYIYINRYMDPPTKLYNNIFKLVQDKDYFVLTTNVDHCFQKAGFDKNRLFYTQGDYGLFQCSKPCHYKTYDNKEVIRKMVLSQGFTIEDGQLLKPKESKIKLTVPTELIPKCPRCGRPMAMNLRADDTFVQDAGWDKAASRYEKFMENHRGEKVVFIELGVGYNTPGIIKYTFWQYAYNWKNAFYICINSGQAYVPPEIEDKSIGIDSDIAKVINDLNAKEEYR
ncbi:Sir2 silent information regulator family NAD-dependent deacetylase [Clostridium sp. MSJ-8]|uniref:SIR2 family NAD-dependent protein deacylase n=1 Tax=Clostridium sp. MSJ-8 TaxID=2841510 RepID=UPI0020A0E5E9|nr:Sir2 silent information regulator family NAD-dependent deacetylase [Clostridium sp. MSJ-8]